MTCIQCQHVNPAGAKFCNACGAQVEVVCGICQHRNPPVSRFCNECGTLLAEQSRVTTSPEANALSRASKTSPLSDVRHQTRDPRPVSYTPPHLAERIRAAT